MSESAAWRSGGDLQTCAVIVFWSRERKCEFKNNSKNAEQILFTFDIPLFKGLAPLISSRAFGIPESVSAYIVCDTSSSLSSVGKCP